MIKASEFRLGNWMKANDGSQWIIKSINRTHMVGFVYNTNHYEGIKEEAESVDIPIENIFGIPLTEEILRGTGININRDNEYRYEYFLGADNFSIKKEGDSFYLVGYGIHINSLHQLQNLFFALTGKELDVKL